MSEERFIAQANLQMENSFAVLKEQRDIDIDVTIGIKDETYGWFEFYDVETGGEEWYAEGGLWFKGKELTDYDGVFDLPDFIKDRLLRMGYDVEL
jgi:hypothetical protein